MLARNDLQIPASSFRFELLERLLDALRRRVQVGAGHLDVRMAQRRLHLVELPAGFEQLRTELMAQVLEVQIVDLGLPSSDIPPGIRQPSWNGLPHCVAEHVSGRQQDGSVDRRANDAVPRTTQPTVTRTTPSKGGGRPTELSGCQGSTRRGNKVAGFNPINTLSVLSYGNISGRIWRTI